MKKFVIYLTLPILVSLFFTSCDDDPVMMGETSVVDLAVETADLSSLVAAVQKAGLATTLSDLTAKYTVFAPTNAAFSDLLDDLGLDSLEQVPTDRLKEILLFHVLDSEVKSTALSDNIYVSTLNKTGPNGTSPSLYVQVGSSVTLNGSAKVQTADVEADNGVVHIIDKVMLEPDVVELASSNPNFSSLVAAVSAGGLVPTLQGDGPFTVFAPDNAAFTALLNSNDDWSELGDIPDSTLDAVLKYHVVSPANVLSSTLTDEQEIATLGGSTLEVDLSDGAKLITEKMQSVEITATDIQGTNGIIHAIGAVLLP